MYVRMHVCTHVHMYICMYVCMYVCKYACMHACMHVCMYACMYACMYVWMAGWLCDHRFPCAYQYAPPASKLEGGAGDLHIVFANVAWIYHGKHNVVLQTYLWSEPQTQEKQNIISERVRDILLRSFCLLRLLKSERIDPIVGRGAKPFLF